MTRRILPVLFAVVLGVLPTVSAVAQDTTSAPLTLDQCLRTALANNLDLISAKQNPAIAEQQIEVNMAPFDGVVEAGANYNDSQADEVITAKTTGTEINGNSSSRVINADASFSHLLEYGGSYALTYNWQDINFGSTSIQPATGFLNRSDFLQDTGGFTLDYSMPLLNGFGKEVNTVDILLARGNLDISHEDLRLQAMTTMQSVEDAYWDVLAASEALRISNLALERAKDLLELNRKKVEVGTLAPIEITEAEAGVASQVEAVIASETLVEDAEDLLLQLLATPQEDPIWNQRLVLTDRPSYTPVEVDLEDALATALERRPEMATARQSLRNSELSERVAKKGTRHGLDLTASVTPNRNQNTDRLVATIQPPGIEPSDTNTDSEDTNWAVGLRYRYNLRNRASKATYAIAQINTQKSDISLRNAEQTVRVDVRRATRNMESGLKRVEAAEKNVELQQKKLEAEQKKFDNGMSTSFEVLTFQNDLADAELSLTRARLDYVKSLTALEHSKGTLLEARGLSLGEM